MIRSFVKVLAPGRALIIAEHLLTNWGPLSVRVYVEKRYGMCKISKTIPTMCVAVVLDVRIARIILVNQTVMTNVYWLPYVFLGISPTISVATKSSDSDADK